MKIKAYFDNGEIITTRFNGTIAEAKAYYLGKLFNVGAVNDKMAKCIKLKIY